MIPSADKRIIMLRVIGCITQEHDLRLVGLALLVCILATNTSVRLLMHGASRQDAHGRAWTGAAMVAFSCGVWTTHFLGMLAFLPDLPSTIDVPLGILSLALVAVPAQVAFSLWARLPAGRQVVSDRMASWHKASGRLARRRLASWCLATAVGLLIDAGIGLMHFVGMRSLRMPAAIHYDPGLVAASLGLGAVCSVAAIRGLQHKRAASAAMLLTLAVVAVHFLGMGAMTLEPVGALDAGAPSIPKSLLAIATGGGCLLILGLALLAFRLDQHVSTRLANEAKRFRALADATFEGLIFERAGRIVDTNRAMCRLMGADAGMLVGRPIATVISGGVLMHPSSLERPMEYELIQQDGCGRPVEVLWRRGADPDGHVLAIRDISREKSTQLQLHRLGHFDLLTGVANRQLLQQTLQKVLASSGRIHPEGRAPDRTAAGAALLCIGLDRFKAVNDTLGPRVGDLVLIQAARRLSAAARDTDTVARIGGDEFAVIRPLTGQLLDEAALAEHIVTQLGLPYEVDGQTVTIGGSVGVALFPADGTTTLALMTSAALALDRAKREGRGTWRYCELGMDSVLREPRALANDLREALVRGQLSLAYQPFFLAATLQVAGYEALLRWDHPNRGRISPAEFIPIAEEHGLIVAIGQWVLETACAEAAAWNDPLVIAVNLSPAQLGQENVVHMVNMVLRKTRLSPSRLELEITEGVLIGDTQHALRTLTALKALGVTLAMDDFGTGYSSLSYLKKFPFDKLKIDRSFIRDLEDETDAEAVVQAIIALSRSLRLKVTAEGVETQRQLELLRAEGCSLIQGFLLGRPVTAQQLGHRDGVASRPVVEEAVTCGPASMPSPLAH